jgi:peptidoglycan/xylan/chitin deacetylase (PgdA/CDA1 family)
MATALAGFVVVALLLTGCASGSGAPVASVVERSPFHRGADNAVVRVVTDRRVVALTFDDGPSARYTPRVLRELAHAGARATFFVVGAAALQEPAIVRAAVRAGHEIGDHTFHHARLPSLPGARVAWELDAGARAIEDAGAPAPAFSRPPWGDFDERVAAIAAAQRRPLVGWDLALDRELDGRDVADGVRRLVARVRRGSIILAHDGRGRRDRTLAALPLLLELLRARGFETVTISGLIDGAGRAARGG